MNEAQVPDLYELAFIPGVFRCPKCEFVLVKSSLCLATGIHGIAEADRESEECPNDGTMMVHVTYRERLEQMQYERQKLIRERDAAILAAFPYLIKIWRDECFLSLGAQYRHPAYQHILKIGPALTPLILADLKLRRGNYWFEALKELTGVDAAAGAEDPVKAWLNWGVEQGHLKE
jgi:hypothetical protein